MKKVPYIKSPSENACALACHLMVAKTFFPETTLDDLKSILRWKEGYVVWAFPFWSWLLDRGIEITDYDSIPYDTWLAKGFSGLKTALSQQVYSYLESHTHDPDSYLPDMAKLFTAGGPFSYIQRQPRLSDLKTALDEGALCEVVIDSRAMNNTEGFSLHRVLVLDIDDTHITFHDPVWPDAEERPFRKETIDHFLKAWPSELAGADSAELCIYRKK